MYLLYNCDTYLSRLTRYLAKFKPDSIIVIAVKGASLALITTYMLITMYVLVLIVVEILINNEHIKKNSKTVIKLIASLFINFILFLVAF